MRARARARLPRSSCDAPARAAPQRGHSWGPQPCRAAPPPACAQVIGPTLGAALGIAAAVVCWPVGAVVWVFSRPRGRHLLGKPCDVYSQVSGPIPV